MFASTTAMGSEPADGLGRQLVLAQADLDFCKNAKIPDVLSEGP